MYLHISHILKLQYGISVLNVSAVFKILLCGHNLNYGKTKQHAISQLDLQNWAGKRNFPQSKRKRWKKNRKKIARVWPRRPYPCGNGSYNFEKHEITKRKRKVYLIEESEKEASSGEKKSGSQSVNNSLASFRHQRGRKSTDPRPANACTNSCG